MSAKEDFDLFGSVAEMLGLDEEERESFVTSAMRRRGHKPRIDWTDSENDEGGDSGDFFQRRRQTRKVQGRGGRQQNNNAGWQYGSNAS
jgi:hypothetical protein